MGELFSDSHVQAIAQALGDTNGGLSGTELAELFRQCGFPDDFAGETKWRRLHKTLWNAQCHYQNRGPILGFIRKAMRPERHLRNPSRFEEMRHGLNIALAFCGLAVEVDGTLTNADRVRTIPEAERRARVLRSTLESRGVHADILIFCRAELLVDDYFHAVLEATKSIAAKLRTRTGLDSDGADLVDKVLGGRVPLLAVNTLATKSERSEQTGFISLLKGIFGMFRNPTAHEPRVHWFLDEADAQDLMALLSLVHRRIDAARPNTFGGTL
jgi:uncharacterized protein (TIGR02391 family)